MDCLSRFFILYSCISFVVASRFNPQLHDERLHELEKWPFTTTTPLHSYKELNNYSFQSMKLTTTTANPQQVLAQMFNAKEISDMSQPPKVNKNPLMFQNYEEEKTTVKQKPQNNIKVRNNTRTTTTNRRTTTTSRPVQKTTTTTKSRGSIIFNNDELNNAFTTPPLKNVTNVQVNSPITNVSKANITSDEFATRLGNQEVKPKEVTTEKPAETTVNPSVALNPGATIQAGTPNQVVIQAINPIQTVPVNPTLNTGVPQYILADNQMTLSSSNGLNTQMSNQPTLYTIVTVPNNPQQIFIQTSNIPSIPQSNQIQMQSDIKNTKQNVDFASNKDPTQLSSNPQYILISSPNQSVNEVQSQNNQMMLVSQVPNNQMNIVQNSGNVPMVVNTRMQDPSSSYFYVDTPQTTNNAPVSNNVPYTNTVMVSISG